MRLFTHSPFARSVTAMSGLLCLVLVLVGLLWRNYLTNGGIGLDTRLFARPGELLPTLNHPFLEVAKLIAAFFIGRLVSLAHEKTHPEGQSPSMAQAQVLLCISGAFMMIIIGDSLARAFGVAGGAAIVRFRTPVDNPRDAMILFLLLALGMACGLGAFATAGLATLFLVVVLHVLSETVPAKTRSMILSIATSRVEPARLHIAKVFSSRGISFEPRVIKGESPVELVYAVKLPENADLASLTGELRGDNGAMLESVSWIPAKELKKKEKEKEKLKPQNELENMDGGSAGVLP